MASNNQPHRASVVSQTSIKRLSDESNHKHALSLARQCVVHTLNGTLARRRRRRRATSRLWCDDAWNSETATMSEIRKVHDKRVCLSISLVGARKSVAIGVYREAAMRTWNRRRRHESRRVKTSLHDHLYPCLEKHRPWAWYVCCS